MAAGEVDSDAVRRGIDYLLEAAAQRRAVGRGAGTPRSASRACSTCAITATAPIFPLWALARYRTPDAAATPRPSPSACEPRLGDLVTGHARRASASASSPGCPRSRGVRRTGDRGRLTDVRRRRRASAPHAARASCVAEGVVGAAELRHRRRPRPGAPARRHRGRRTVVAAAGRRRYPAMPRRGWHAAVDALARCREPAHRAVLAGGDQPVPHGRRKRSALRARTGALAVDMESQRRGAGRGARPALPVPRRCG